MNKVLVFFVLLLASPFSQAVTPKASAWMSKDRLCSAIRENNIDRVRRHLKFLLGAEKHYRRVAENIDEFNHCDSENSILDESIKQGNLDIFLLLTKHWNTKSKIVRNKSYLENEKHPLVTAYRYKQMEIFNTILNSGIYLGWGFDTIKHFSKIVELMVNDSGSKDPDEQKMILQFADVSFGYLASRVNTMGWYHILKRLYTTASKIRSNKTLIEILKVKSSFHLQAFIKWAADDFDLYYPSVSFCNDIVFDVYGQEAVLEGFLNYKQKIISQRLNTQERLIMWLPYLYSKGPILDIEYTDEIKANVVEGHLPNDKLTTFILNISDVLSSNTYFIERIENRYRLYLDFLFAYLANMTEEERSVTPNVTILQNIVKYSFLNRDYKVAKMITENVNLKKIAEEIIAGDVIDAGKWVGKVYNEEGFEIAKPYFDLIENFDVYFNAILWQQNSSSISSHSPLNIAIDENDHLAINLFITQLVRLAKFKIEDLVRDDQDRSLDNTLRQLKKLFEILIDSENLDLLKFLHQQMVENDINYAAILAENNYSIVRKSYLQAKNMRVPHFLVEAIEQLGKKEDLHKKFSLEIANGTSWWGGFRNRFENALFDKNLEKVQHILFFAHEYPKQYALFLDRRKILRDVDNSADFSIQVFVEILKLHHLSILKGIDTSSQDEFFASLVLSSDSENRAILKPWLKDEHFDFSCGKLNPFISLDSNNIDNFIILAVKNGNRLLTRGLAKRCIGEVTSIQARDILEFLINKIRESSRIGEQQKESYRILFEEWQPLINESTN